MKILVVNWLDRENPQAGGAEVHLHEIFGRLASRGHEVTLLSSRWPGSPTRCELDGIEVHRVGGRYVFGLVAPWYFRRHLQARGYDVIVEDVNKVPVFAPWWSTIPVVLIVHHLFGNTAFQEASLPIATATWLLERPVPRAFRELPVVAVSDSTRLDLVGRGMDPKQITVIPNGVDLDHLTPDPTGQRFTVPTLLYLGRLKKYKRIDLIILALAELKDRGVACRLIVAGKGDHRDELEHQCRELGVSDMVIFPGFVNERDKLELLRSSWLHVLTSPKEGWGIIIVEAAACGTPTVASDSPGLRDSVIDGRTGVLVPHGASRKLADELQRLLTDRQTREAMGREARSFAEGFRWDESADRVEALLLDRVALPNRPV
ncbi:MAG: glycosyltransferase family 4 protein [Gemmatimonadota bacterium]|nr:MAG: glycosyltransferase family 4 protein [Gemmatimonadota bacterium]